MEAATQRDREAIERQLGRPPRALAGVAARCPHGGPSVIAQRPYDAHGTPFPTTLWLSCRALVHAVGELESGGGIAALEGDLAARPALRRSRVAADARVAALRARLAPAGPRVDDGAVLATSLDGGSPGAPLKCLHAHAAVALAAPPYALGSLVLERAGAETPERCCAWA
ncbi:MAG TPA: DUF501 domain-containing protein [Gaiellales bacterium]